MVPNPVQQAFSSGLKRLDMIGLLLRHGVGGDVNLDKIRCTLRSIEQQTVTRMEAVKRATNQAAPKAPSAIHGGGSCFQNMMSSPVLRIYWAFNSLCPAT
jgi:hypothetical protein